MSSRYIAHITLTTGHTRQSPRSEVGDGVIDTLLPLLSLALTGEHAPVPGQPGYTITGGAMGRCCLVTLWRVVPDTDGVHIPVLHTGVAGHSRCGAELWRRMHELAGERLRVITDRDRQPVTPWCADLLDIGADLTSSEWTGDFSRCLAWTWLGVRECDAAGLT